MTAPITKNRSKLLAFNLYKMARESQEYNILIGKDKYWDYIFLDEAFKYKDGMKWLCWTRMQFHTEDEYEDAKQRVIDDGRLRDLWVEAVKANKTDYSLEEWSQEIIDEWYSPYDDSYRWKEWVYEWLKIINEIEWTEYEQDYSDCTGWWRMFDEEMLKRGYWEWVYPINFRLFKRLFYTYEKPLSFKK